MDDTRLTAAQEALITDFARKLDSSSPPLDSAQMGAQLLAEALERGDVVPVRQKQRGKPAFYVRRPHGRSR